MELILFPNKIQVEAAEMIAEMIVGKLAVLEIQPKVVIFQLLS